MDNNEEKHNDTVNLQKQNQDIASEQDMGKSQESAGQTPPNQTPPQNQQVPPFNQQENTGRAQQFAGQMGNQLKSFVQNKELMGNVGLICACIGFAVSFIFTFISCSKSASNSISIKNISKMSGVGNFRGSYLFIVVVIGMILAIAGGVMAFMSKQGEDFGMKAKLTFLVVIVTMVFAIIPNATICAYNNSLNNATEDAIGDILKDYPSLWD